MTESIEGNVNLDKFQCFNQILILIRYIFQTQYFIINFLEVLESIFTPLGTTYTKHGQSAGLEPFEKRFIN